LRASPDLAPRIPGDGQRVDRICNHNAADAKIVPRHCVSDPIARFVKRRDDRCAISNDLLNRVYTQVHCADLARQLSRNRCLPGPRQTSKDNQHCFTALSQSCLTREQVRVLNEQAEDEEQLAKRQVAAKRRAARQRASRLEAALREVERLQREKMHDRKTFGARASSGDPEAHKKL
jgi:hypothetical protein